MQKIVAALPLIGQVVFDGRCRNVGQANEAAREKQATHATERMANVLAT